MFFNNPSTSRQRKKPKWQPFLGGRNDSVKIPAICFGWEILSSFFRKWRTVLLPEDACITLLMIFSHWLSPPNVGGKKNKRDIHQVSAIIVKSTSSQRFLKQKKISNFSKMQSPPAFAAPQLTTRRSGPTIAAKALCVAWISCTSTSCPSTCALSPPEKEAPQVTAVPS